MDPCALSAGITALANTLACKLNDDELNLVSAAFTQLGDTLATISAQRIICEKRSRSTSDQTVV